VPRASGLEKKSNRGVQPQFKASSQVRPLSRSELPIDTIELARFLVGKTLVRELRGKILSGRIVETEAYPVGDAAGHAWRGLKRANRSLFLERGRAYVYFIYGTAWCLNVTSELPGIGGGVLLRAMEPLEGIASMRRARNAALAKRAKRIVRDVDIARGPGRLAQAMRIDGKLDGVDLCDRATPALWLGAELSPVARIGITTRIGLSREGHRRLRFYERGSPFVSGPRTLLDLRK
jgi:DNA-3-methyladenine glycosylase